MPSHFEILPVPLVERIKAVWFGQNYFWRHIQMAYQCRSVDADNCNLSADKCKVLDRTGQQRHASRCMRDFRTR